MTRLPPIRTIPIPYRLSDLPNHSIPVEELLKSNVVDSSGNISSPLLCNDLPNPFMPMASLPPRLVFQAKLAEFVIACSLAVCFYIDYALYLEDIIMH